MWMRVIVFEELCFMGLAAKSWLSESRIKSRRTCLSHGDATEFLKDPTFLLSGSRTRDACFLALDLQ